MIEYVYQGKSLPDKPVCITMDDGYLSNYEIAWPPSSGRAQVRIWSPVSKGSH